MIPFCMIRNGIKLRKSCSVIAILKINAYHNNDY